MCLLMASIETPLLLQLKVNIYFFSVLWLVNVTKTATRPRSIISLCPYVDAEPRLELQCGQSSELFGSETATLELESLKKAPWV